MYCDKSLDNLIIFCKKSCIQYAVKFVNAATVPITCNHPKIDIINPGFSLATPRFLIRFLAWTKLAQAKLWVSHCIFNYSNHVYNSTFIVFLSANIQHCINNIGLCYFTVAPIWPKSYRAIGPKSTFLCHLVHHRTISKTLITTPLPYSSSHGCATCLMIYLCGCVRSVELVMIIIEHRYSFTHAMH